jgi:hypothetical protein
MAKKFKMKAPINEILGVIGGAVAAGYVTNIVAKNFPDLKPTYQALIPIAAGFFLAGNKSPILRGVGFGMVGKGGSDLAGAFLPSVNGVDDIFLSSPADQSILSLPADQSVLMGDDDFLNGDDDFINGEDDFLNGDDDFINGDDEMISQMEEVQF